MLDAVLNDAQDLRRHISRWDQQKLDEYLNSVREVERRILDMTEFSTIYIGGDEGANSVMTSMEAAEYLKMHVKTVCRLAKEGKIPAKKVGSEWRFLKNVLDKWLAEALG